VAILIVGFGVPEAKPGAVGADPEQLNVRKVFGRQQEDCFAARRAGQLTTAEILELPSMPQLLAVYLLVFLAFNLYYVAFPVYATTAIAWSLSRIGVYFAALGFMMALTQGPLLKFLSKQWSDRSLAVCRANRCKLCPGFHDPATGRVKPGLNQSRA
jgi:DHA1 family tetracycline resistance protein-like MFS transporter